MKSKLFISLSTIALVGISLVSHAAYVKYMDNDINHVPKGDCLEMMCQYGCVEDNGFIGRCCPSAGSYDQACNPDAIPINECCQMDKGLVCSTNGKCACPADKPIWMDGQCCFDVGCGCNIPKTAEGCCQGVVKGCDGVCGSGKVDVGCGCGVGLTAEGCCPGVVKGCDGVCGSGKVAGCDGVCGSGKVDAGCGCGVECPQHCQKHEDCPVCQTCCDYTRVIPYKHCTYGGAKSGERHGNQVCLNLEAGNRHGLYDCWEELTSTERFKEKYRNLHTGEVIEVSVHQQRSAASVKGCRLDPREAWAIIPELRD